MFKTKAPDRRRALIAALIAMLAALALALPIAASAAESLKVPVDYYKLPTVCA